MKGQINMLKQGIDWIGSILLAEKLSHEKQRFDIFDGSCK